MGKSAIIVTIVIIAVVLVGIVFFSKPKKSSGNTPDSPTGPPTPQCGNIGQACVNGQCCDSTNTCRNGYCIGGTSPGIQVFLLGSQGNLIGQPNPGSAGVVQVSDDWPVTPPTEYWYWNGSGQLIYRNLIIDAGGNVTGITDKYINGGSVGYVTFDDSLTTGVAFSPVGEKYALYSLDFTKCASVESDTGKLLWGECLQVPYLFDVTLPSNCTAETPCDCCYPGTTCVTQGGVSKCSNCLGSSENYQAEHCPTDDFFVKCDEDSGGFSCVSKCDSQSSSCHDNEHAVCMSDGTNYSLVCMSNCTGGAAPCEGGTSSAVCTQDATGGWDWICPVDPCSDEEKAKNPPSAAPAPASGNYTWNTDHFEPTSGGGSWLYPMWDCNKQVYQYNPGCNQTYKQTCGANQVAVCGNTAANPFQWQCVAPGTTDLCGLSADKGVCGSDSTCMDIAICDGKDGVTPSNSPNDWRWICPSNASRCEAIEIMSWYTDNPIPVYGNSGTVTPVQKDVNTPVYPTISNSNCRSQGGTDNSHPGYGSLVNNPAGNIMFNSQGYPNLFIDENIPVSGDGEYIVTTYQGWNCISENPCGQGGEFANLDGSSYTSPISINPPVGQYGPPSSGELFSVGKCAQCGAGYGGDRCQFPSSLCNNGTIESCNTPGEGLCTKDEYQCNCQPGYKGLHCQFTAADCNNNGTPEDTDTLVCDCTSDHTGSTCQACKGSPPNYPLTINNGDSVYILANGYPGYYYLSGDFTDAFVDCGATMLPYNTLTFNQTGKGFTLTSTQQTTNAGTAYTLTYAAYFDGHIIDIGATSITPPIPGYPVTTTAGVFYITSCGFLSDGTNYYRWSPGSSSDSNSVIPVPITEVDQSGDFKGIMYLSKTSSC